jgi:hypothetical protein
MADKSSADRPITKHIEELVGEEHTLRAKKDASPQDKSRLSSIEVELDQCWDLLRQRRAKREFGDDPNQARVRPPGIVENYEQ